MSETAAEKVPCVCGDAQVRPYPNDTGYHSTTECVDRAECMTCSGRGVWMDEPCLDCAPFYCYPCARGDHDEHKLAWVPDVPCECPECVIPSGSGDSC